MAGDNIYEGPATRGRLPPEVRGALQAAARRRRQVLRGARQPRRSGQIYYKPFNMDGHRYYTFVPPVDPITRWDTRVRFFALDSTYLDREQMRWLDEGSSTESRAEWKIALPASSALHLRPLHARGARHRASRSSRRSSTAASTWSFSGHEHIYQRAELQNGILYFISGGAGSLRAGDAAPSPEIATQLRSATITSCWSEIDGRRLFFQAINRQGETVDAGALTPAETADGGGSTYCGHGGPSLICLTLCLEHAHPFRDRGVECRQERSGRLIEARAAEQIRRAGDRSAARAAPPDVAGRPR